MTRSSIEDAVSTKRRSEMRFGPNKLEATPRKSFFDFTGVGEI
ncbi:hypothetical protein ACMGE7_07505 [Macrococcus equi]